MCFICFRQGRHVVHLFQRQKCVSSASDKAVKWFISFRQVRHTFHLFETRQTCVSSVSGNADICFISFRQSRHVFHLFQTSQTCGSSVSDKAHLYLFFVFSKYDQCLCAWATPSATYFNSTLFQVWTCASCEPACLMF